MILFLDEVTRNCILRTSIPLCPHPVSCQMKQHMQPLHRKDWNKSEGKMLLRLQLKEEIPLAQTSDAPVRNVIKPRKCISLFQVLLPNHTQKCIDWKVKGKKHSKFMNKWIMLIQVAHKKGKDFYFSLSNLLVVLLSRVEVLLLFSVKAFYDPVF